MKYRIKEHEYLYGVKEFITEKSSDGKIWFLLFENEYVVKSDNTYSTLIEALNAIKEYAARLDVKPEETIHEVNENFTININPIIV
jgi:hypothetical protein